MKLDQIGTGIVVIPTILAAMLLGGVIPVEVPLAALFVVVAACGLIGGVLNALGEGRPMYVGAITGVVVALGGFGAVYAWIQSRESVMWIEITVAFVIGALPGFALQLAYDHLLAAPAEAEG